MFITFEGGDGSGKTTQVQRALTWLRSLGLDAIGLREPGGTHVGDHVRELLLHHRAAIDARSELLLFCASRAQIVAERIEPQLRAGGVVVCDRFADSTLAYQGYGRGLDLDFLRPLLRFATRGISPDHTVYLDISVEQGIERRRASGGEFNRLDAEALDFHRRVRDGYLALARAEPDRWHVVQADRAADDIAAEVRREIARKFALPPGS